MAVKTLLRSFAGGEIAPELFGRIDLDKFQTGLDTCRNFIVLPHGPVRNRQGFKYILEVKDSSKRVNLIEFSYSNEQTYVLEFGDQYVRFHTNGGTLLETAKNITGITQASPGVITSVAHGFLDGQWVYIASVGGMTEINGRYYKVANKTADTFTLTDLAGNAINTTAFTAYTSGGTAARVYEVSTPYLEADVMNLHYVQSADVLTLVHPSYAPRELKRLSAANWTLTEINFVPNIDPPSTAQVYATVGTGTTSYNYVVTTVADDGLEESIASSAAVAFRLQVTKITNANPGVFTTDLAHGFAVNDRVYITNMNGMPSLTDGYYLINSAPTTTTLTLKTLGGTPINTTSYGTYSGGGSIVEAITGITQANPGVITVSANHGYSVDDMVYVSGIGGMTELVDGLYYVETVPATDTLTLRTLGGTIVDTSAYTAFTSGGTVLRAGIKNNLATSGNKNTITWSSVPGAIRYNVYKQRNGLYGYIGQTDGTSFVDENIVADVTRTPPEADNPFSGANNYPGAVSYFEQRRCFGGTNNQPQNLWMTRSATESNMNYSIPTQDDDAITLRIAAREVNRIRHIVPLSDLILLTTSGEWRVWAQNSDAITPTTVSVRPQSYNGANNVQPVVTGNSCIYVRTQSSRLHELSYNWESNAYKSDDVSLMSPHMFDDYSITDMTVTKTPVPIVWCTRSDGTLLGMTYMPNQKVWAWHRHDTDGEFESVAAVSENNVDVLYAVVKRTIDSRTVRYVERLEVGGTTTLVDAFHVDSGLTYDGSPATTIRGLWHLEGETVSILADGAVHPQRTVTNGAITLEQSASVVHIGLPITADIKTLPLSLEMEAFAQGRQKNVNKVWLRVYRSSGIKVGPSFGSLTEAKQRTTEPYGSPPAMITEEVAVMITPSWGDSGQVCVRQTDPLPLSILSMVIEVALGG